MSSSDEASVQGADFGLEGGERTGGGQAGPGAPTGLGLELGAPRSGEGEGGLRGQGLQSELEEEAIEEGRRVLSGREGRPGSPAEEKADTLDFVTQLAVESAAIVQQLTGRQVRGARRYPSPESCAAELSAIWGNTEAGPSGRGALAPSCVEAQQASAATHLRASGSEGGRAWGNRKRGTKSRMMVSGAAQPPSSDHESSDEFSEIQPMRVSICFKGEGQSKSISPREPGDTARHSSVHARESFRHTQGSLPTSAPRGLTSAKERQGELEAPSSKKVQSVVWGKGGSRPSFPGAAVAEGDPPRATPKKKATQEKKSLGAASRVTLGRAFPSWGQRLKAAPLGPATFPPISGIPLLGKAKRYSLLPLGPKQSKPGGTGKRSVAGRTRESQPMAREDKDPNREAVRQGQLLTRRPMPSFPCVDPGEFRSVDPNARVPQPPGNSQQLDLSQGGLTPGRSSEPSGDQEPSVHPPVPERQQQAPRAQGCPRCVVLQKEIDDLKEQLAAMQSLIEKFQALGS